ncbi:GNAT family N-acetyltransferase [Cupriavidus basilensis]|uniref:GCN5-related N-acetyltransferase n=1 Tax=Cupriavidus basilensis TaxID=68895 RepID=A0A0C4YBY8_9BURK|nr:GNAT family N-acetyltransferase [Cupriavidus basilensis]AJG23097.1 GCN5-related N-acetyltransferase [Cupriavidus basilensis]
MDLPEAHRTRGGPTLHEVTGTDAELLQVAALLAEMDNETPLPLQRMRALFAQLKAMPYYRCYLMRSAAGEALGTFCLLVFPVLAHDGRSEAIVESVVVTHAARGTGVGTAMMHAAMRLAEEAGASKLVLSSSARRVQAHRLYRRLGFAEHGTSFSIGLPVAAVHL